MYQCSMTGEQTECVQCERDSHVCINGPCARCPHSQAYGGRTSCSVTLKASGARLGFSVGDIILVVLDHVVGPAPVAEETVLDDLHDKIRSLPLCHVRAEPVFQKFDCLATKTGQACVQHECNQGDDCIHIGAHSQITSDTHLHEPLEGCGFHFAPHNHHHLVCQLDVWFPAKVATR